MRTLGEKKERKSKRVVSLSRSMQRVEVLKYVVGGEKQLENAKRDLASQTRDPARCIVAERSQRRTRASGARGKVIRSSMSSTHI